ncbi:hypothetical protein GGI25_001922 [Coemansia spiralis]|uniref:Uncharacterized protein n=2 Tax=Coemansia TaxID=4863 RepID=A0A9W8G8X4_9FUNG|nr:hypothetical protein EDC05_002218 [Coemansia umbellata]KAJ2623497.1 hypothetical protein GGI26_002336 [Coemansia sp. RSA 1358]KAJ2678933.1 hypothetical protein GGI25_001922 [Coemansia spiralis]
MVLFMVDINNDSGTVAADKKLAEENAKEFIRLMPNVTKYIGVPTALNAMFCKILDFSSPLDGEIEIINRMLNTSNLALEISISLTWAHDTAMLDKINWTSLTQLDIIWQVNITELVAFTRKLPSLKRLKASRVNCTAHTIRVISLTLGLQDYDLTPLNTSIQKITLKCKLGKDVLANPVDDITEYLKARLAALKYIAVSVYKDR